MLLYLTGDGGRNDNGFRVGREIDTTTTLQWEGDMLAAGAWRAEQIGG